MVQKLIFIGHRGTRTNFDENTLNAFNKAIEYGVDYIEFDVRKTKDEKLVIMHDSSLERTTNGFGLLKDYNFIEIRQFVTKYNQSHIPSLVEVLNKLKGKTKFMIELKDEGLKDVIPQLVERINICEDVIFSGRVLSDLKYIKAKYYQSKVCYNISKGIGLTISEFLKQGEDKTLKFKPDFISISSDLISTEYINICHRNQILALAWNFIKYEDPLHHIKTLINQGIDGILFDNYENILHIRNGIIWN